MKRRIVQICVVLVIGATVNIAFAWAISLRLPPRPVHKCTNVGSDDSINNVSTCIQSAWGRAFVFQTWGYGPTASKLFGHQVSPEEFVKSLPNGSMFSSGTPVLARSARIGTRKLSMITERSVGWPCLSLCEILYYDVMPGEETEVKEASLAIPTILKPLSAQTNETIQWQLPTLPLWPGFAINTVFYAAILWLVFASPFALRRGSRRRRGLCVKCGYDLRERGHSATGHVCPECGNQMARLCVGPGTS